MNLLIGKAIKVCLNQKIKEEDDKAKEGKTQEVYFIGKLMEKCYNKVKDDFVIFKGKVTSKVMQNLLNYGKILF